MRVLICDDHRLLAEALGTVLHARGHEPVRPALHPDEAVLRVREDEIDVCVMDVSFPGADGVDGIRRVIEASPRTRVVVLTGSLVPEVIEASLAAGASTCVDKSERADRIVEAIEQAPSMGRVVPLAEIAAARSKAVRRSPEQELIAFLTPREREVLERLVAGQTTSAMAREMSVAYSTARTHIQNVLTKLGVHSKLAAATLAVRAGVMPPAPPRRDGTA